MGLASGSSGARTAEAMMSTSTISAAAAPRSRSSRRRLPAVTAPVYSGVADARIEHRVDDVGQQVDEHIADRDHKDDPLHDRKILVEDPVDNQPPDAGSREDGLHHDGAGQQLPKLQAKDRNNGDQGVLEGVSQNDQPFIEAFGARSRD